ncbi:phosphatase PAP2 family protein [Bacillus shivajii]|uniref:phosphatase PAP2 family protein n=1 Tax=Bacillus shivajii TaxID=1983719 RepID=UPI001CFA7FB5|nr:phosphatase PAP2 family protein [Bacillus shivajii]UCZ52039.1 phosphatase PAP2 family protein [Bacillus shivajii]
MRELETEILRFITSLHQPFIDYFAWFLTFLGNEEFYFIILPFVYWCVSKPFGIRLLYIFLLSVYLNAWLKVVTAITRPIGIEGVHSLYVDSAEVGTRYPHDSFPSGHAQGSATLWGFIAYEVNRKNVWVALGILVGLISVARLYTGVHWPTDVVVGVALAAVIIFIAHHLTRKIVELSFSIKMTLAIVIPMILMTLFADPEGFKYAGFLLGAGVGYLLEGRYLKMGLPASWGKRFIAYAVGLAGIFALQAGLKGPFPETAFFDALRYAIMGLWGILLAPIVFVKLKIYPQNK